MKKEISILKKRLIKGTQLEAKYFCGKFSGETQRRTVESINKEDNKWIVWVSGNPYGGQSCFVLDNINITGVNSFDCLDSLNNSKILISYKIL